MAAIYTSSNKQKLIENMIQKQYDQLLEICEQAKSEVIDLGQSIDGADFSRSLEIEKTQSLIASIEQDIQARKQDAYNMEIKNRYQQLFSVYETTKKEIGILENLLQDNSLGETDHLKESHDYAQLLHETNAGESFVINHFPEPKRERLNLKTLTSPLSRTLDSRHDDSVAERLGRLEKIASVLNEQKNHEFDAEGEGLINSEVPIPMPTAFEIPEIPVPEMPTVSEISEVPVPMPIVPETPEVPVPMPVVPETPEVPVPMPIVPETPEVPMPMPVVPEIPKAPVPVAPEMPKASAPVPTVPEAPNVPEISAAPVPIVAAPSLPKAPLLTPTAPPIPKPKVPEGSKALEKPRLKEEIKKQAEPNRPNQSKKRIAQKGRPPRKKKGQPSSEKQAHSALSLFLNVIFYFMLIFSIIFVVLFGNQNPQAIPRNVMGFSVMRVVTNSMEPEIPVNSLIITRATDPNDLQVGEIVTYGRPTNTTLTHRIYEIVEDYNDTPGVRGFILKGDALLTPDPGVAMGSNMVGRVIFISAPLGSALMLFQNHFWIVMIVIILILITLFVLQGLFRTKKPQKPGNRAQPKKPPGNQPRPQKPGSQPQRKKGNPKPKSKK